jgi:cleavage stimulation factor subunit 3
MEETESTSTESKNEPIHKEEDRPSKHLRSERAPQLEARISKDPYDVEAWQMLLSEAQSVGTEEQVRDMFERFLEKFPTSGRHWALYVEFELRVGRTDLAEAIFARSLRDVLSVDLWRAYLAYVRQTNENTGETGRQTITKAYETALQYVGIDKDAGSIWSDYLAFIKSGEANTTYEEQQRMDALRRVYRKAIAIPLTNIESLWRDYDTFENGLNRITAKKFLAEQSPIYMTARTAMRELKQISEALNRSALPRPPRWTEKELNQASKYKCKKIILINQ